MNSGYCLDVFAKYYAQNGMTAMCGSNNLQCCSTQQNCGSGNVAWHFFDGQDTHYTGPSMFSTPQTAMCNAYAGIDKLGVRSFVGVQKILIVALSDRLCGRGPDPVPPSGGAPLAIDAAAVVEPAIVDAAPAREITAHRHVHALDRRDRVLGKEDVVVVRTTAARPGEARSRKDVVQRPHHRHARRRSARANRTSASKENITSSRSRKHVRGSRPRSTWRSRNRRTTPSVSSGPKPSATARNVRSRRRRARARARPC